MRPLVIDNFAGARIPDTAILALMPVRLDNFVDVIRVDYGIMHVLDQLRAVRRQWPLQINFKFWRCSACRRRKYLYVFYHIPIGKLSHVLKYHTLKLDTNFYVPTQTNAPKTNPVLPCTSMDVGENGPTTRLVTRIDRAVKSHPKKHQGEKAAYAVVG